MYTFKVSENALGATIELYGPGMPQYAKSVLAFQELNDWAKTCFGKDPAMHTPAEQGEQLCRFLHAAFEAGKEARSLELRRLLGVPERR